MDIARHLAAIDELCFRPLPAEHGSSPDSGHPVAVLESTHGVRGGGREGRSVTLEQYTAYRDALHERLAARWGPSDLWNLDTVLLRTAEEEIPEPWAGLAHRARVAYLWEAGDTGRWVALAVADRDDSDEIRLLVLATPTAPP
ncbi:hypothetical protein [Streptomyces tagetis]|uniref:Uncharacterized protein n=1 Tax=Streptomyces tagetis TaxID=2820809 RepID=A0A941B3P1_9ACTN|nr:hypothetical protein [Streptomyces sp. RG38]MBQ0830575.1 hypothetical protein [Streptomyces sp. RG38]